MTGQELFILAHWRIRACCYSPDGQTVISAQASHGSSSSLIVWDSSAGRQKQKIEGHPDDIYACAFSPNGRRLASACRDKVLRIWDVHTGKCIFEGKNRGEVYGCAYSPDGKRVVCTGSLGYIGFLTVWNTESKTVNFSIDTTKSGHGCAFSPDGLRIVTATNDDKVNIWDAANGKLLSTFSGHSHGAWACAFAPDGKQILSAGGDGLRLWPVRGEAQKTELVQHAEAVSDCKFSPDGLRVVSVSPDEKIKLWDGKTGKLQKTVNVHDKVYGCAWSPDGNFVASASYIVRIWDLATSQTLCEYKEGSSGSAMACGYSPDGRYLICGYDDYNPAEEYEGKLLIWDLAAGKVHRTLERDCPGVGDCLYSPDGRFVAAISNSRLKLWEVKTGSVLKISDLFPDPVRAYAFSPNGQQIMTISPSQSGLEVRDLRTGALLQALTNQSSSRSCTYFRDGKKALLIDKGAIIVLDVATGVTRMKQIGISATCATIGSESRNIAVGEANGSVRFLQVVGFEPSIPYVTPARNYDLRRHCDENTYSFWCEWCSVRSSLPNSIRDVIDSINRECHIDPGDSPCLNLPDEAWEVLRLISECPHCHQPIRFNPFIVDNRD